MRDSTQKRVEEYAASVSVTEITLEVAEKGIEESKKMMAEAFENGLSLEDFMSKKEEVGSS